MALTSMLNDVEDNSNLNGAVKLKALHTKVRKLLFWSMFFALWSYLVLIFRIFALYARLKGAQPAYLTIILLLIYGLCSGLTYLYWQNNKRIGAVYAYHKNTTVAFLNYQIVQLGCQRKLITTYLITYGLLFAASATFFAFTVNKGLLSLLKVTAPIGLIVFVMGIYFIVKLGRQKKYLSRLKGKVSHVRIMNKIMQN